MTPVSQLSRPIIGELDASGRLLHADDALLKLHQRSGGGEGTVIAIPALFKLAVLSNRLKMRLARAVRVSDDAEKLELWVEVEPVGKITRLRIQSWRVLNERPEALPGFFGKAALSVSPGDTELQFDLAARLIRVSGLSIGQITPADFGNSAKALFERLFEDGEPILEITDAIESKDAFGPKIFGLKNGGNAMLSGQPLYGPNAVLTGYVCNMEPASETEAVPTTNKQDAPPGALFGKHLAPVLRQPLGRIIANAETIGSELQGPIRENYAAYARDIANAARHLSALVDDLGDLEAVERDDFSTAPDKIELGDLARRVAGLLALKAADHSIRLITPDTNLAVHATAEFRRVLQILLNLVTNAIRYSPDGTEVQIDIHGSDSGSYISVTDQGSGIAIEDRDRVFEKFERLGRSGDGGSGLGLYISRRLARAMGGDLTVDQADNGGAIFTLRLPTV